MKKEDLIKKLEQVELPQIELESHRSRLRMALLSSDAFKKRQEVAFLEAVRAKGNDVLEAISSGLTARRPLWKVALTSIFALLIIAATVFSIPSLGGPLKATLFPEGGRRVISGPQLSVEEKEKAMEILLADYQIKELLYTGAVIETVLPIHVEIQGINSETGEIEEISETWAQAWITRGEKQWGAQVDLVRGKVVVVTE